MRKLKPMAEAEETLDENSPALRQARKESKRANKLGEHTGERVGERVVERLVEVPNAKRPLMG